MDPQPVWQLPAPSLEAGDQMDILQVALPGSDSHWMLQGQGWLNRNHRDDCLFI